LGLEQRETLLVWGGQRISIAKSGPSINKGGFMLGDKKNPGAAEKKERSY